MRATKTLILALLGMAFLAGAQPIVIATSEVFGSLARTIGGEDVLVITIIPAGFCPAHYDLRPADFLFLAKAEVVLYHGFEAWLDRFLANVNPEAKVVQLRGPWNFPAVLAEKAQAVAESLSARFPEKSQLFQARLDTFLAELAALAQEIQTKAQELRLGEIPAIVMLWQEGFARWLGLNIVATYPPEERLSLKDLAELAQKGREHGVKLVIDNLQSGVSFGGRLAQILGASHVVLTNFPGPI
ncbi:MAG: metal ABC transporter substrate-binding protein, partial [Candidatus Bipolaricaulaceae bacterium]